MTGQNFNQRMKEAREASGRSLDDVVFEIRVRLPQPFWASRSTLARLEGAGKDAIAETKADPILVQFLCFLYGVTFDAIAPELAAAVRTYMEVIDLRATPSDEGIGSTGWLTRMGPETYEDDAPRIHQAELVGVR